MMTSRRLFLAAASAAALTEAARCARATAVRQVSLLEFIPAAWHADILRGRDLHDVAPHIQRAIDESAAANAELTVPAGSYGLAPRTAMAHADPHFVCEAALALRSNMRLRAQPGARFRILPNLSSDARPRAMALFGSDAVLHDIEINGLAMDMNGAVNPISAQRREGTYLRTPQAHIFVSGGTGDKAARIDRCRIIGCTMTGSAGVSCIVTGQTNGVPGQLGRDWTIAGNRFLENGLDTDDHSSIFGLADGMAVHDNVFENVRPFDGTGGNTAYEVHGSDHVFARNRIRNYLRGVWVSSSPANRVKRTQIRDNQFATLFYGVDFFGDKADLGAIEDTRIYGNRFVFDDRPVPGHDLKGAVQIASPYPQSRIDVRNNVVEKRGRAITSAFLVIAQGDQGSGIHDQISATGNQGSGLTCGVFARTSPTRGIGSLSFLDNKWEKLAPAGIFSIAAGYLAEHTHVVQPIQSLTIGGGSCSGSGPRSYALFVNTLVQSLTLKPVATTGVERAISIGGKGRVARRVGTITRGDAPASP